MTPEQVAELLHQIVVEHLPGNLADAGQDGNEFRVQATDAEGTTFTVTVTS